MLLVRSNCFVYNPPDTRVCRDCTQVFNYYNQEIDRLLDKSANKLPTVSDLFLSGRETPTSVLSVCEHHGDEDGQW